MVDVKSVMKKMIRKKRLIISSAWCDGDGGKPEMMWKSYRDSSSHQKATSRWELWGHLSSFPPLACWSREMAVAEPVAGICAELGRGWCFLGAKAAETCEVRNRSSPHSSYLTLIPSISSYSKLFSANSFVSLNLEWIGYSRANLRKDT